MAEHDLVGAPAGRGLSAPRSPAILVTKMASDSSSAMPGRGRLWPAAFPSIISIGPRFNSEPADAERAD